MSLINKSVLVTRPQHQSADFIQLIEKHGGRVLAFPSLEIRAVEVDESATEIVKKINSYDMLIFVSANAVIHFINLLRMQKMSPQEVTAKIAVIGVATSIAATQAGFEVAITPGHGFNSEVLLGLSEFEKAQIETKAVLIVRGQGGLERISETLTQRGARISYLEVYQRCIPINDTQINRQQLSQDWLKMGIDIITVTSNASLQNLYDMLEEPGKKAMLHTRLIVPSKRCADLAKELGFQEYCVAQSATDQHMLEALS